MHAFTFFGAVPRSIPYDNDRCLVAKIQADGTRNRTHRFSAMLSHYVIGDRYGRPGKGNDKGKVEGLVGYGRRYFMVPMPRFATWDAFNDYLEEQCHKRQADVLRGHKVSIGERLKADLAAMRDLPAAPFEACDLQSGQVTSTSVVRYRSNDYSVPVAYGHREVWIKGFVGRVVIGCAAEVIADHPRSYDTGDMVFDPVHYLALIERKIMAFDQAAPLQDWELPDAFTTLQRLLEARQGKAGKREYVRYLARLTELELIDRERRMVERRIKSAKFPAVKSLDSFDFKAIPSLNKMMVLDLARCEWIERKENVIALGPSGTGKTHVALGLGLAACQKRLPVAFVTAAALVNELMEARDERRLLLRQRQLAKVKLLIIDELGFVPLSKTGAELLFELISQRYERGSTLITNNLLFEEWTETFGTERLTGALLDRLTHHVNILEMNGESYRLNQSRARLGNPST